jgi:nitroimidazol reductase NimA-like FMN-containing flavoprotein (pyridoxamine 5'-phosphate oxidase superfamily)
MSAPPEMRRADKAMSQEETEEVLRQGFCGRIATIGEDGFPYCVPMLYLWMDGEVWLHGTSARGHLSANVANASNVCFEVDEPGAIFPYGRFECDTTVSFRSVILFGKIRVIDNASAKHRFFEMLMRKYSRAEWKRPESFFPRIEQITLYAITPERITGKSTPLPDVAEQWPALDRTKTPNARLV